MTAAQAFVRRDPARSYGRQAVTGLGLAVAVFGSWLAIHVFGVFLFHPTGRAWLAAPVLIGLQCWLSVGLFIVAHDAMHGSLAPFRPRLNRAVGRIALLAYGGLWYDDLVERHFAHHRAPGTEHDPDFAGDGTLGVVRWFVAFFAEYLTIGQLARQTGLAALYRFGFGVDANNLLLFWALPALLSAVQLFYFGTYLPHRGEAQEFADQHRARTNEFSALISLLTCFHFGYHHEHHLQPSAPWWRLPKIHRENGAAPL